MKNVLLLAEGFLALSQVNYGDTQGTDTTVLQKALIKAGLLGMKEYPPAGEPVKLDYSSIVFTKYINPALDKFNVKSKINIWITVDVNLNVTLEVRENTNVQQELQSSLGTDMSSALQGITPPDRNIKWQWIFNYG